MFRLKNKGVILKCCRRKIHWLFKSSCEKTNSKWTSQGLFQEVAKSVSGYLLFSISYSHMFNTEKVNSPGDKKAAEAATVKFGHLCSSQPVLHTAEPSHDKKIWHRSWAISPTCTSTPTPPPTHYSLEWWMWWARWHCSVLMLPRAAPFWHISASSLQRKHKTRESI